MSKWWWLLGALALLAAVSTGPGVWDKVVLLARAIARAEGFWHPDPNVLPRRNHNPGDLTDSAGSIRYFATDESGWAALYDQVSRMLTGQSQVYSLDMTFLEVAYLYTGNDNAGAWAATVAGELGLSPGHTLREYVEA